MKLISAFSFFSSFYWIYKVNCRSIKASWVKFHSFCIKLLPKSIAQHREKAFVYVYRANLGHCHLFTCIQFCVLFIRNTLKTRQFLSLENLFSSTVLVKYLSQKLFLQIIMKYSINIKLNMNLHWYIVIANNSRIKFLTLKSWLKIFQKFIKSNFFPTKKRNKINFVFLKYSKKSTRFFQHNFLDNSPSFPLFIFVQLHYLKRLFFI